MNVSLLSDRFGNEPLKISSIIRFAVSVWIFLPRRLVDSVRHICHILSVMVWKRSPGRSPECPADHDGDHGDNGQSDTNPNGKLAVSASPGLITLLDEALFQAYEAELVPTVCAASRLLKELLEMKEVSALLLRECLWMVGVPFTGGLTLIQQGHDKLGTTNVQLNQVAISGGGVILDETNGTILDSESSLMEIINSHQRGNSIDPTAPVTIRERLIQKTATDDALWSDFEMIQDFAQQCYLASNKAIHHLTTDRLAESANITLQDSVSALREQVQKSYNHSNQFGNDSGHQHDSTHASSQSELPMFPLHATPADFGIGRCYHPQPRSGCWESPRLYCPDYTWADDTIVTCQRLLKNLSKHRFVAFFGTNGWNRDMESSSSGSHTISPPTYASSTPHPFPSLEATHAMKYLVSNLLFTTIPHRMNQLRAAAEANTVVSKRLYLVKCEYRSPFRAYMESWNTLKTAPKLELVERYLREYHTLDKGAEKRSVKKDETEGMKRTGKGAAATVSGKHNSNGAMRRKSSSDSAKNDLLQKQRVFLETLMTEKYCKDPAFLEAIRLEKTCDRLEMEMSQLLLPLSRVAREIIDQSKGRLRAVAVLSKKIINEEQVEKLTITEIIGWRDLPHIRELLRRLKSILCDKPGPEESFGIRPLLLDLQGVPRRKRDQMDLSLEIPYHRLLPIHNDVSSGTISERSLSHVDYFILQIDKLLHLLDQPGMPCLAGERRKGFYADRLVWQELVHDCKKLWNGKLFRAQYQNWLDMVKRQHSLNSPVESQLHSLTELSERLRDTEIELSIAMASRDQLELVRQRIEALIVDENTKFIILAQIVNDVALRELNENVVVTPTKNISSSDFPTLSSLGVFGKQLTLSSEKLPVG